MMRWSVGIASTAKGVLHMTDLSTMSRDDLQAMVAKYMAANKARKLTMKVSEKGAVSLYGMGRWPVTLYASQWDKLIENIDEVKAFVDANRSVLSVKV